MQRIFFYMIIYICIVKKKEQKNKINDRYNTFMMTKIQINKQYDREIGECKKNKK